MAKSTSKRDKTSRSAPLISRPVHLAITIVALLITVFLFFVAPVTAKGLCLATAALIVYQWVRAVRRSPK
jgi:hypothetical protein